jgi:predicted ArsR family transcriptional regulator
MSQTQAELEAALDRSRAETRSAFENRALMYAYLYEELVEELGGERAVEVMKRAIYRRGLEVGRKYAQAAEAGDLAEVGRIFVDGSPCEGAFFEPAIEELEEGRLVLRMCACPLVDAWRGIGLPAEEIDTLCEIAAAVD